MSPPRRILIVEHDMALRTALVERLAACDGFLPGEAGNIAEAEARLAAPGALYDAILLDLRLPDGDGCDLCARLRRDGRRMPVIMLTGADAEDAEQDVVRALDAGANDCLGRPFRPNELLARLRAHLRAFDDSEDAVFMIGPYVFRPAARLLTEPGRNRRIRLTGKECSILRRLYHADGRPVGPQALLEEVWGRDSAVTTHTLETHIYRLRLKIEPDSSSPRLLLTNNGGFRNGGYRLDLKAGRNAH